MLAHKLSSNSRTRLRGSNTARIVLACVVALCFLLLHDVLLLRTSSPSPFGPETELLNASAIMQHTLSTCSASPNRNTNQAETSQDETSCLHVPGADRVMVILKTGATELYQKLPAHVLTTFKCIPHLQIFSDLEQEFAGLHIHDAVQYVSKQMREQHADFELHRRVAKWQRDGQDISKLVGKNGWNLDKWKFLPMLHRAYESASDDIDWFVVIEADTSLSWVNLLLWLKTMDPKQPYYLGSQNAIGNTQFAHGGSGIVISRNALDRLELARHRAGRHLYDGMWEDVVGISCCGDEVVARAFLAVDIPLTPAWPLIQGETINSIDWTKDHWCTPPITWHHVSPIEIHSYWEFQKQWVQRYGWGTPYLYGDVFSHFVEHHITVNRTSWNNLSKDRQFAAASLSPGYGENFQILSEYEEKSVESEAACAEACMRNDETTCLQWMFTPGRCHLGKTLRFGISDETLAEHWTSGWIQERVHRLIKQNEQCSIRWSG